MENSLETDSQLAPSKFAAASDDVLVPFTRPGKLKVSLISLHGLIRAHDPQLGWDADTGGQIKYVLDLARCLARQPQVSGVELVTRQIIDSSVDDSYAQLEEPICEGAKIVRIPFGPKRYLKKESLWPYIDIFVDQVLQHFKRNGLPAIIHGHYADAGLAGAQLARLLHIPFVFTGHSLGRVKRERLSLRKGQSDGLESKYKFSSRVEAEEIALETAAMIVTSTNQEVQQQYEMYDHYVPARMEVIPPGVDLNEFWPAGDDWQRPAIADQLDRFLKEPEKPMILTLARPDERKNLEKLVQVYGESEELQELANLVLILGSRDNIRDLPKAQQAILTNILHAIDRYDLYGKVAYPKTHAPGDVPDLYRLAAQGKGAFINPALTEPFGLTLLEAGATGLPIVATNDGGPQDIIANCRNGLLIDPLDSASIERALLRTLTEPEQWEEWSQNGVTGTREHYSWDNHAQRYLRDLTDILNHSPPPVLSHKSASRRLPEFDRLIITDLDNTLTGDDESLRRFIEMIDQNEHVGLGIDTGRTLDSAMGLIEELHLPKPDLIVTDVGTQLHYGEHLTPDRSWRKAIGYAWNRDAVCQLLDGLPGFYKQDESHQSEYKVSYQIDPEKSPKVAAIKKILREAGVRAKVVLSLGMYLDVIPVRGGSDMSVRHILWKWSFAPEDVLVAGDSGNDAGMLQGRSLGIVVGNYSPELERLRSRPRIYFAEASHAAGIIEGIDYYNFLDKLVIPNDRIE
ncbi:Mannosylfructose-phosphate synthase [Posidoniimonas polymericola]|uniref:sucrose-phosphate synthase n=1 Tax=Posidoniimonas polymericola TaxID=2528002 RepID=A0A5C5YMM1_9BACT|nr:HAD-IIB family hydrolase [Posidoniimonas polymericola]TWT76116.1 Mannosylfructose-phosphate synthase [Posidoniimonas polymericola]